VAVAHHDATHYNVKIKNNVEGRNSIEPTGQWESATTERPRATRHNLEARSPSSGKHCRTMMMSSAGKPLDGSGWITFSQRDRCMFSV
jgi:hypothetical protein